MLDGNSWNIVEILGFGTFGIANYSNSFQCLMRFEVKGTWKFKVLGIVNVNTNIM